MAEGEVTDTITVASSDQTPKGKSVMPRRDFLKVAAAAGVAAGGALAAGCAPTEPSVVELQQQRQKAAEGQQKKLEQYEKLVPKWLIERTGEISISSMDSRTVLPPDRGSAVKFFEGNSYIALLTAEHIGGNFMWGRALLKFPYAKYKTPVSVDARWNADNWSTATPNVWSILYHSPHSIVKDPLDESLLHPIRLIVVQKSLGSSGLQAPEDERVLQAYPGIPPKGEKAYIVGYPMQNPNEKPGESHPLKVLEMSFDRVTEKGEVEYAGGIPLWLFRASEKLDYGFSGSPIVSKDGIVLGIHSGFAVKDPTFGVGIPFNIHQPLAEFKNIPGLKGLK